MRKLGHFDVLVFCLYGIHAIYIDMHYEVLNFLEMNLVSDSTR